VGEARRRINTYSTYLSPPYRIYKSFAWKRTAALTAVAATTTTIEAFPALVSAVYNSKNNKPLASSPSRLFATGENNMSDEVAKAKEAATAWASPDAPTIFDKLLSGEIPADVVYEDDLAFAFRDVNPQAPVHILCIPKKKDGLTGLSSAREDQKAVLGHLLYIAAQIGKKECPGGYRVVINDGKDGAQSVAYLHVSHSLSLAAVEKLKSGAADLHEIEAVCSTIIGWSDMFSNF